MIKNLLKASKEFYKSQKIINGILKQVKDGKAYYFITDAHFAVIKIEDTETTDFMGIIPVGAILSTPK